MSGQGNFVGKGGVKGLGQESWYQGKASVVDFAAYEEKNFFNLFIILLNGKKVQPGISYSLTSSTFRSISTSFSPLGPAKKASSCSIPSSSTISVSKFE